MALEQSQSVQLYLQVSQEEIRPYFIDVVTGALPGIEELLQFFEGGDVSCAWLEAQGAQRLCPGHVRAPLPAARGTVLGAGELPAPVAVTGCREMGRGRCWATAPDTTPTLRHTPSLLPRAGCWLRGWPGRHRWWKQMHKPNRALLVPVCSLPFIPRPSA